MKNKIICLMVLLVLVFSLGGCGSSTWNEIDISSEKESNDGVLTLIYNDEYNTIVKDNRTWDEYISRASSGTCVVVDKDGKPFIE